MKKLKASIVLLIFSHIIVFGQTGYKVPMDNFSSDTSKGLWTIDVLNISQFATYVDTLGSKCLRLQLSNKSTWSGVTYNLDTIPLELDLSNSPVFSYEILAKGISPLINIGFLIDNHEIPNNTGGILEKDTISTSISDFHKVFFDFSKSGYLDFTSGDPIEASRIHKIKIVYHDKYLWPFTSISGTVYIRNIIIGDSNNCKAVKPVITVQSGSIIPCIGGKLVLKASAGYSSYKWNNDTLKQTTTVKSSGTYTVKVFDNNGCQAVSDPYVINASQAQIPSICAVSVISATDKNVIFWDRPSNEKIKRYIIYKESSKLNKFDSIGTVNFKDFNSFIDENSNAQIQSDRYSIAAIDSCNTPSPMSSIHKTIHLTLNERVGGGINLIWENYEGLTIPGYIIFRGTDKNNMKVYTEIASSKTTYSIIDSLMPYYQVGISLPKICSASQLKAEVPPYTQSLSSIVEYKAARLNKANIMQAFVYPNPFNENLTVEFSLDKNSDVLIEVVNAIGQKTAEFSYKKLAAGNQQIQLSVAAMNISEGMCYIKIVANEKTSVVKCNYIK
jgi:hypothetical protein